MEDNPRLRGAFLGAGAARATCKPGEGSGGSGAPPAFPLQPGKEQQLCSPRPPTDTHEAWVPAGRGGLEKAFQGAPPASSLPLLLFGRYLNAILITLPRARDQKRPHRGQKRRGRAGGAGDASPQPRSGGSAPGPSRTGTEPRRRGL